jgi:hypothetical protein
MGLGKGQRILGPLLGLGKDLAVLASDPPAIETDDRHDAAE